MQITPLLSPASKTAETTQKTNVTADYNKFLTLLTAQLQNQDPLAPMDASQFTNQLVQFAALIVTQAANIPVIFFGVHLVKSPGRHFHYKCIGVKKLRHKIKLEVFDPLNSDLKDHASFRPAIGLGKIAVDDKF